MRIAEWSRSLLLDDPDTHGAGAGIATGSGPAAPLSPELYLTGRLVEGPFGLELHAGGGGELTPGVEHVGCSMRSGSLRTPRRVQRAHLRSDLASRTTPPSSLQIQYRTFIGVQCRRLRFDRVLSSALLDVSADVERLGTWACANQVLETHGENAPLHVAEQIEARSHWHRTRRVSPLGKPLPNAWRS